MKQLISIDETSKILGVTPRTVYKLVKSGEIRAKKFGGKWRVFADELLKLDEDER